MKEGKKEKTTEKNGKSRNIRQMKGKKKVNTGKKKEGKGERGKGEREEERKEDKSGGERES